LKRHLRFAKSELTYRVRCITIFYDRKERLSVVRKIDWESQIGRRLKLRDLHVFVTVAQRGSMAKAAEQLGVSPSAVSEVISDLEHTLGLRLLDRNPQGIEPNVYGRALLKRCTVVFDELKQGIGDLESLADPAIGEIRIGCSDSVAAAVLRPVITRFSKLYPRIVLQICHSVSPTLELPQLRDRCVDLCLVRSTRLQTAAHADLTVEVLFYEESVVAAGMQSRWAARHKIDLAELANEPWILASPESQVYLNLEAAFRARGLPMPRASLMTYSVHLRTNLVASGDFIAALPGSILRFNANQFSLKILPIELPGPAWPVAVVTLKNRTLSPVVQLFISHIRAFTRTMAAESIPEDQLA
jgi:DNA-binding transcriptional LysR family regulator